MNNADPNAKQIPKNQARYNAAMTKGLELIAGGASKAEAARAIYEQIREESREVIIQGFIEGAKVTEKGSPTYFYNIRRQFERKQRVEAKGSAKAKK